LIYLKVMAVRDACALLHAVPPSLPRRENAALRKNVGATPQLKLDIVQQLGELVYLRYG
jgi:hypothetical protein